MPYFASLARRDEKASRASHPTEAGQSGGVAFAPVVLAGSEWVAFIQSVPNAVFMAPAAAIQQQLDRRRIDRGAVRGRAGAFDREIADPADRPADRRRFRAPPATARPSFRSTPAARPACSRAPSRR